MTVTEAAPSVDPPPFTNYAGMVMAAPMVRVSVIAFRLFAARCGSDVVFSEELVAAKLQKCVREARPVPDYMIAKDGDPQPLGSGWDVPVVDALRFPPGTQLVEFVRYEPYGKNTTRRAVVFSTVRIPPEYRAKRPWSEGKPFILQMGVSDPEAGARSAALVKDDVDGFDVNMGCPKKFSVSNGMGAALMTDVDRAAKILTSIRAAIGPTKPFSFKTRVFETVDESVAQLTKLLGTGAVHSVTLHARTRPQRSDTKPRVDLAAEVAAKMRALFPHIAFVFNGSIGCSGMDGAGHVGVVDGKPWGGRAAILEAVRAMGFDGGLVARDAMWNPTVLLPSAPPGADPADVARGSYYCEDYMRVHRRLLEYHAHCGNGMAFLKYHLTRTFGQKQLQTAHPEAYKKILAGKCIADFAIALGATAEEAAHWESVHSAAGADTDAAAADEETSGAVLPVDVGGRRSREAAGVAPDAAAASKPQPAGA